MNQSPSETGNYLIRTIFQDYREQILNDTSLNEIQKQTATMISMCKTEELGFQVSVCPNCGRQVHYASCNNRNCPCCQWASQQGWIKKRENEIVPDIPYYHIVLTLPHELNLLIQYNMKLMLSKLFSCSAKAVIDLCKDRRFLGAVPGIVSVLHTWTQDLLPHYHVHMIVSGGGLNELGQFVSQNDPTRNRNKQRKFEGGFFLPMPALTKLFRGKMMNAVKILRRMGKLVLPDSNIYTDPIGWASFCDKLYETDWVGYLARTFNGNGNAIEYLARYTFRTAISNNRILNYDGNTVTFSVTDRNTREKKQVCISAMDFIKRVLSHVLPKGFTRVRYFGFLSNARRTCKLKLIHIQCHLQEYIPLVFKNTRDLFLGVWNVDISVCKCCGAKLLHLPRGRTSF